MNEPVASMLDAFVVSASANSEQMVAKSAAVTVILPFIGGLLKWNPRIMSLQIVQQKSGHLMDKYLPQIGRKSLWPDVTKIITKDEFIKLDANTPPGKLCTRNFFCN